MTDTSSLPFSLQHADPKAPFVEHKGQRLVYVSAFESFSGPFDNLQKLREGNLHLSLFKDPDSKIPGETPAPESIRQSLTFYGLTLADIGSSEEELSALVEKNARLEAARDLLQVRSGFSIALYNLKNFEAIRAFLQVSYESLGTTEEEITALRRELHIAAAKVLLAELRLPNRGDSYAASNLNPDSLAQLEEHLAKAAATPADLGYTAEEWEALKKQRLLYHAIWFLEEMKKGLEFYADPFREFDFMTSRKPFRDPDDHLALVQGLLAQMGETPSVLGLSDEEFQDYLRQTAVIRVAQNLVYVMEKGESDWKKERMPSVVESIRQDMKTYIITWDELGVRQRRFRYHLRRWGVK